MTLSWACRRQLIYGGTAALVLMLLFGSPFLSHTIRRPLCTDGRQDGAETGVDCGGACSRLCTGAAIEPRVLWQRVFNEGGGVASALLYGENPNKDAGAFDARYYTKTYDSDGVLVAEKETTTAITPGGVFAVFAPNLFVGARVPARADFEPRPGTEWRRDAPPASAVRVRNIRLSLIPLPRVEAIAANTTDISLDAVFTTILYDETGNAIGASQTTAKLPSRASASLVFAWRAPFVTTPVRAEILFGARAVR